MQRKSCSGSSGAEVKINLYCREKEFRFTFSCSLGTTISLSLFKNKKNSQDVDVGWMMYKICGKFGIIMIFFRFSPQHQSIATKFRVQIPIMIVDGCFHRSSSSTVTIRRGSCNQSNYAESASHDLMEIVCEQCFQRHATNWCKVEISTAVVSPDSSCCECNACPARWYDDLDSCMCDQCRLNMFEEERGFCSTYDDFSGCSPMLPDEIIPGCLYLGSINSAAHIACLEVYGISHILVCATFLPVFHSKNDSTESTATSEQYVYHRLPLSDSLDEDIVRYLPNACQFIEQSALKNEPVLVHCQAGVSRSASVCIAYLMKTRNMTYNQAYQFVKQRRSCISPNDKFVEDLSSTWAEILESNT